MTSARPTRQHYGAAAGLGLFLIGATVLIVPVARQAGPYVQVFIAIYASLASAADLVTAYLLYGQFRSTRLPALAVLAATYTYSGLIIIPFALTFPQLFAPTGLLHAGPQTAIWLWTCWHAGFPAGLLLYSVVDRRHARPLTAVGARRLLTLLVSVVPATVVLLVVATTRGHRYLPVLLRAGHVTALFSLASPLGVVLGGLALSACLVLWRGRTRSVAQLWLAVAALACVLDIAINLVVPSRYTLGWYASRVNTLVSASVVLLALLYEVTQLYHRLSRSEARFRTLIDQAPIGACIVDEHGVLETVNDAYCAISGFARDEMVGQRADLLHPLLLGSPPVLDAGGQAPAQRTAVQQEYEVRAKNGQALIVLASSVTFSGVDDTPERATFVVDITDRSRAARALEDAREHALQAEQEKAVALQQAAQELARSNAELQQFAYVASHDLQEPLRTITSYLTLLQRRYQGKLGADADEFIGFATDGARRMSALIAAVLDYARVGTRGGAVGPTDCSALVGDAVANLEARIAESGARVVYDTMPTVQGDAAQLRQLFQNLIANALKFARPTVPPRVRVEAERQDDRWLVCVVDNGIGIDRTDAARIFQVFERLHTREEYEGTGIGLSVCQKIVERHGGRIWVESTLGQGTTVLFTLPTNDERKKEREDTAA